MLQDESTLLTLSSVFGSAKATQEADSVVIIQARGERTRGAGARGGGGGGGFHILHKPFYTKIFHEWKRVDDEIELITIGLTTKTKAGGWGEGGEAGSVPAASLPSASILDWR